MKIYTAIEKLPGELSGGHLKPWIVRVNTENGLKDYVVKLFSKKYIDEYGSVSKEVFGNVLANSLDLCVPGVALIKFDSNFIATLSDADRNRVESCDQRLKYGCQYIPGASQRLPKLPSRVLDRTLLDRIYAFDYLINNLDRKNSKPNILLTRKGYFLIDHEASFVINIDSIENYKGSVTLYRYDNHIFFPFLKRSGPEKKKDYFHTFVETLRLASLRELKLANSQLNANNQVVIDFDTLITYLETVKGAPHILLEILNRQIK